MRLLRSIIKPAADAVAPALEEVSDGQLFKERELVFYGRVTDLEQLKAAQHFEHHEQWEIRVQKTEANALSGKFRVRKTVLNDGSAPQYVLTTKTKTSDALTTNSVPVPTTEAMFMQFKMMAPGGMIKDRFSFAVEGSDLVWEVDMFHKPEGGYFEWAKLDLEVPKSHQGPIPPFPIDMADIIANQDGDRTEEEETKVHSLYDYEFIAKNAYLPKD